MVAISGQGHGKKNRMQEGEGANSCGWNIDTIIILLNQSHLNQPSTYGPLKKYFAQNHAMQ